MVDGSRLGQDEQAPCVPKQAVYRKRHRLNSKSQFESVFNAKLRKSRGPITIFLKVSDASEHRLGLSIGRRLGNALGLDEYTKLVIDAVDAAHRVCEKRSTK